LAAAGETGRQGGGQRNAIARLDEFDGDVAVNDHPVTGGDRGWATYGHATEIGDIDSRRASRQRHAQRGSHRVVAHEFDQHGRCHHGISAPCWC